MKKLVFITLGIILLLNLVSAGCSNTYHYQKYDDSYENNYNYMDTNDGIIFVLDDDYYYGEEIYEKENEYRSAPYDYRFGYSYRTEEEYYTKIVYLNDQNSKKYDNYEKNFMNWMFDGDEDSYYFQDEPSYYYIYSDYMRGYQKHECYNYPPKDKLIYVECP